MFGVNSPRVRVMPAMMQSAFQCRNRGWSRVRGARVAGGVCRTGPARWFGQSASRLASQYTDSLNLPRSSFPMKHSRSLEKSIEEKSSFDDLYGLRSEPKRGTFTLHDGPPYANGHVHFGHAINKLLKDMFIKRKVVENAWVHYTPGWDCHGLPIELKALSAEQAQSDCLHPLEVRSKARALAERTIEDQKRSFREWFISSDWRHCYYTFSLDYSLKQLRAFYDLYSQALIFRDTMPVYWSPSTRTALAEAELQYNQSHTSRSVFLKYGLRGMESCSALVWTTTPWTLLANEAIAFSEKLHYCLVEVESQVLLLARELLPALGQRFEARFVRDVSLEEMHSLSYEDPFDARPKRMIASGHVTTAKGTGLVHVSPHHGLDDFRLAQQYGLPVRDCLVNREGLLEVAPGICLPIIEDNRASDWVLGRLEGGHMLAVEDYQHSYPYDWRTGKPVIIKPSQQWFLNMDPIRDQCLQQLSQVRIYPEVLRKEMESQLRNRPNWCLSRQRKWGVPIPVFYERHNPCQPILNDQVFSAVMRRFQQEGCDVWWKEEPESLLRECSSVDASRLVKGEDILDIWFDSGCSWLSVLPDPPRVADLYLEGIDQIRGWFQSSLITSVALRGRAPFKAIFIHGFALDSTGRKMSKSEGNVIDPMHVVRGQFAAGKSDCGVDGLRFWVARHASSHNDVLVDVQHFRADVLTLLNRVRNSFRFLLGYLCPPPHTPLPAPSQLTVLDKYLLFRLAAFHRRANQAYDDLNLNEVVESLIRFFLYDFSTFYLTRVKDRLYCERRESAGWRSALAVLHHTYHSVAFQLAPITPHLVLEANLAHPLRRDISLWDLMNNLDHFVSDCLFPGHSGSISSAEHFESLFALLHPLIADLNRWSQSEQVHLSEWQCHLLVPPHCLPSLQVLQPSPDQHHFSDLCQVLQVCSVEYSGHSPAQADWLLACGEPGHIQAYVRPSRLAKCARCRRMTSAHPEILCARCREAVG